MTAAASNYVPVVVVMVVVSFLFNIVQIAL